LARPQEGLAVPHLLPLNRLAARLRLPSDWLRAAALAGRIPCLRVGRRLLFNAEAVERALAQIAAETRQGAADAS
jgi:excisionase family DNA binding protein